MSCLVFKFGGTSVATIERVLHVAKRIQKEKEKGYDIVVVVSAMGKTTDKLVEMAHEIMPNPSKREMDTLLTTGEQVTISLLSMALQSLGLSAQSFTGWQAGILTEGIPSDSRIVEIQSENVRKALDKGQVAVVAGFQGVDSNNNITTLGRGGSDTTAVALAAALGAERCDIYTDVDGVYTSDPRYVPKARKLQELSYDEMLELANLGAGVLHPRAVEFAKNYNIPLAVRSSYVEDEGTIMKEEVEVEKDLVVRGVAFMSDIVRVTVGYEGNYKGSLVNIFTVLADNHINVDIIVQTILEGVEPSVSFTITKENLADTVRVLEANKSKIGYCHVNYEEDVAKVSIVGSGMVSNPGVAAKMFDRLHKENITLKMVSTSEIKISVVIPQESMLLTANALHDEFELAASLAIQV
ncbi:aspartate kinase [Viridibacillus arvi]|uniref:aspartate kinase n=1 Tax=Viridibacillus arvi TaxID=263475 RepID=UPI00187BA4E2|nr:aspartate kinase [Viridibacillus sp. JNUCC-6]QOV12942.1 aspartate kinase [Viridibacillus sp. JNUCC-6]